MWMNLAPNLPNLQNFIITKIHDENFINVIIENIENLHDLIHNDRLKILQLHSNQDNLKLILKNRKVTKCIRCSCKKSIFFNCSQEIIRKNVQQFDFTFLTQTEFDKRFEVLESDYRVKTLLNDEINSINTPRIQSSSCQTEIRYKIKEKPVVMHLKNCCCRKGIFEGLKHIGS